MGAANTYQEFLVLDLYGNNFDPDWIISLTGRNDGYNALTTNNGAGTTNGFVGTKNSLMDFITINQNQNYIVQNYLIILLNTQSFIE